MDQKWMDFLANGGIYDHFDISYSDFENIAEWITTDYSLDAYCPNCKGNSVFVKQPISPMQDQRIKNLLGNYRITSHKEGQQNLFDKLCEFLSSFALSFLCSRDLKTVINFHLLFSNDKIVKIGQYPSPIDISPKISNKYSKLLGPYFSEYKKSIVLHSEGYHVGAYAYLRRIIEHLLESAHQEAQKNPSWNDEEFINKHFEDKLKLLKDYLPDFFVKNVPLYGLVSKGIHELSEDDCESMYPILKSAIDYTLDEIIENDEKQRRKEETEKAISSLSTKYGQKK